MDRTEIWMVTGLRTPRMTTWTATEFRTHRIRTPTATEFRTPKTSMPTEKAAAMGTTPTPDRRGAAVGVDAEDRAARGTRAAPLPIAVPEKEGRVERAVAEDRRAEREEKVAKVVTAAMAPSSSAVINVVSGRWLPTSGVAPVAPEVLQGWAANRANKVASKAANRVVSKAEANRAVARAVVAVQADNPAAAADLRVVEVAEVAVIRFNWWPHCCARFSGCEVEDSRVVWGCVMVVLIGKPTWFR
jgi:hypothetical protein